MISHGQRPALVPAALRTLLLMAGVLFLARVAARGLGYLIGGAPLHQLPILLASWTLLWVLAVLCFVPGILVAERVSSRGGGRAWPYAAVVLGGSALVSAVTVPLCDWLGIPAHFWVSPGSPVPRQATAFLDVVMRVGLGAFLYAGHRQQLEAAQAVQALEMRRTEMMGRLAASRLDTARTRVQPEAFIAELRVLRTSYLEDPAACGAGLEALIFRLRAASRSAAP